jgi:hypothetical protein
MQRRARFPALRLFQIGSHGTAFVPWALGLFIEEPTARRMLAVATPSAKECHPDPAL